MNGIKIYLSWADRVYAKTIKAILILLMISIPLTCGLAVVFRYFIKKPLHGSDEILMLLGVWLYYLGFVSAAREKSHIHARVIESAMKKNETIAKLRMLNAFVAVIICLYLIDLAWNFFKYSLRVGKTTSILMYPMIFYESAPIICFVPALFYTVAELVFYAKRIKKSDIDFIGEREEVKEYLQNTQNGKGGSKR